MLDPEPLLGDHGLTLDSLMTLFAVIGGWFSKIGYDRFKARKNGVAEADEADSDTKQILRVLGAMYKLQRATAEKMKVDIKLAVTDIKDLL